MDEVTWWPRSTRNNIAMAFGLLSLILCIAWNFLPIHHPDPGDGLSTTMASRLWPNIHHHLLSIDFTNFRWEMLAEYLALIFLILLTILSITLLPAWPIWQASAVMRVIPSIMMLFGFAILFFYSIEAIRSSDPYRYSMSTVLFLMSLNFLTTAISLLLFKNESSLTHNPIEPSPL